MQVQTDVYVCGCVWICVVVCRCLFILLYLFFVPAALVCWRRLLVGAAALVSLPACSRIGSLTGLLVLSSIPHIADPPIPCTRDPTLPSTQSPGALSLAELSILGMLSAPCRVVLSALAPFRKTQTGGSCPFVASNAPVHHQKTEGADRLKNFKSRLFLLLTYTWARLLLSSPHAGYALPRFAGFAGVSGCSAPLTAG